MGIAVIGDSISAGSPWEDETIGWTDAAAAADPRLHGRRTGEIAASLDGAAADVREGYPLLGELAVVVP